MARSQQQELRVLQIVDQVLDGGRTEDDLVECKSEWPDAAKSARRIAGQANAAHGELVLWIIGLDEDSHRLSDPGDDDPADWWAQVSRRFDELAPDIQVQTVPLGRARSVIALTFTTDRAPYVITTSGKDGVHREVPFREATSLRSAHRHDLLRILVPTVDVPGVDGVWWILRATKEPTRPVDADGDVIVPADVSLDVHGRVFFSPRSDAMLPAHLWTATATFGRRGSLACKLDGNFHHHQTSSWGPPRGSGETEWAHHQGVDVRGGGIYLSGPGTLQFTGRGSVAPETAQTVGRTNIVTLRFTFGVANSEGRAHVTSELRRDRSPDRYSGPRQIGKWQVGRDPEE